MQRSFHAVLFARSLVVRSSPCRRRRAWARLLYADAYVGLEVIRDVRSVIALLRVCGEGLAVFRGWRMLSSWAWSWGFGEGSVGSMRVDWVEGGWLRRRERV